MLETSKDHKSSSASDFADFVHPCQHASCRNWSISGDLKSPSLPSAIMKKSPKLRAPRQKAFSHKVRTGCITCRRRRVKCDENKPACLNCTRGNRECGYEAPKAKIFTLQYLTKSSSDGSSSEQRSPSQLSDSSSSLEDLPLFRMPKVSFGNDEENSYLQHWLLITAPMLQHYGPGGEFFNMIVPQFAWESPAVKHLLVALSMTHKKFHTGVMTVSRSTTSAAISHYVSAITDIRDNRPSKLQVTIASLIAWCLELMQNNLPAAVTHLHATVRLLHELKELQLPDYEMNVLQKSIAPTAGLAKGMTALMLRLGSKPGEVEAEYRGHLHAPWLGPDFSSRVDARTVVCDYINLIAIAKEEHEIRHAEKLFSYWFETVRRWDQESIRSPELTALLLLFNVGMALFPASDVAGYSYSQNPDTIKFVVDSAARLVAANQKANEPKSELRNTLRIVLTFVVQLFPGDSNRRRAFMLLRRLREDT